MRAFDAAVHAFVANQEDVRGASLYVKSLEWRNEDDEDHVPGAAGSSSVSAPHGLMDYPTLATLLNGYFGAFNMLRSFCASNIAAALASAVERGLSECARTLLQKRRKDVRFNDAAFVFCDVLVPAVVGGLERMYGGGGVVIDSKKICLPVVEYANVVMLSRLESERVVPLKASVAAPPVSAEVGVDSAAAPAAVALDSADLGVVDEVASVAVEDTPNKDVQK